MTAERGPLPTAPGRRGRRAGTPRPEASESQPRNRQTGGRGIQCSVGVMAYNEEANIAHALESILGQKLAAKRITEIVVVASGCQDRTAAIVSDIASRQPRVRLIEQPRREGKASAINLFITAARAPVLAMVSADLLVEDGAFEALLDALRRSARRNGRRAPHAGQRRSGRSSATRCTSSGGCMTASPARPEARRGRRLPQRRSQHPARHRRRRAFHPGPHHAARLPAGVRTTGGGIQPRPGERYPTSSASDVVSTAGHLRVREQQAYSAPTMSAWRAGRALLRSRPLPDASGGMWSSSDHRARGHRPRRSATTTRCAAVIRTPCGRFPARPRARSRKQRVPSVSSPSPCSTSSTFTGDNSRSAWRRPSAHRRIADRPGWHWGRPQVSIPQTRTFVVLLPGDRDAAETSRRDARHSRSGTTRCSHDGSARAAQVTLACGIIAFPPGGPPLYQVDTNTPARCRSRPIMPPDRRPPSWAWPRSFRRFRSLERRTRPVMPSGCPSISPSASATAATRAARPATCGFCRMMISLWRSGIVCSSRSGAHRTGSPSAAASRPCAKTCRTWWRAPTATAARGSSISRRTVFRIRSFRAGSSACCKSRPRPKSSSTSRSTASATRHDEMRGVREQLVALDAHLRRLKDSRRATRT